LTTVGHFTGIDLRRPLCELARKKVAQIGLSNVEILEGNVVDLGLGSFTAFYLFNPFAENIGEAPPIDDTVPLSAERHLQYVTHVARQFSAASIGTRLATYFGTGWEVPSGFDCVETAFSGALRLWEKTWLGRPENW
jgi:hypothetical protein